MTRHNCGIEIVEAGYYGKQRVQRFKCRQCGKRLNEPPQKPFNADIRPAPPIGNSPCPRDILSGSHAGRWMLPIYMLLPMRLKQRLERVV